MLAKDQILIDGLQYCQWDRAYFQSLVDSGLSAVHVTLAYHELARETMSRFAQWNRHFEDHADLIMPVHTVGDIYRAKQLGKCGIIFGAQNCSPIEDEIGLVEVMRRQGLMIMQLTYNNQSLLATGCYEENDNGLTRMGKQVIEEMNRVGMIIDMSHSAERSTLDTIEHSSRPICISHANPSFFHAALRNKSTDLLRTLGESGGLLGFSLYPFHLPGGDDCSLEAFCQMAAQTVELMGEENIGIGSDLCLNQPIAILDWMRNGRWAKVKDYGEGSCDNSDWPSQPSWFQDSNGFNNLYQGLRQVGFSEQGAYGVLGGNWLRFLAQGSNPAGQVIATNWKDTITHCVT